MTSGKQAAINAALADVGNSYATGWNQPGECLVSVRRWLAAGGINFGYGGPNSGYVASGATQVSWSNVQPGDVVQYESAYSPDSWIGGVHTVLVTGVSGGSVKSLKRTTQEVLVMFLLTLTGHQHHQQDSALLYGVFQAK